MDKPTRVVSALTGKIPDMVPFMFNTVMKGIQQRIVKREIDDPVIDGMNVTGWVGSPEEVCEVAPAITVIPEVASLLGLDSIQLQMLPPIFAKSVITENNRFVADGLIDSAEALAAVRMPDPDDDRLMKSVEEMIKRYRGDFAFGARVRLGASASLLSMGLENLSVFYVEEDDTLQKTVEMYTDFSRRMNKNLSELDFDFFWAFDDIAFISSMLISPKMFRDVFKDNMKKAAAAITKPWIFHSDGNYKAVLDDVIDIGASGIHPIERSSMDTGWLKENYGDRLCLVGNVDIDYTLTSGSVQEVREEVRNIIALLGPGGRFIISDSNSIPDMCSVDNLLAMAKAVEEFRHIY